MSLPGWTLFAPLAAVVAAGLAARQTPHSPHSSKTARARGYAAPALSIQPPRSLDAAPTVLFSPLPASNASNPDAVPGTIGKTTPFATNRAMPGLPGASTAPAPASSSLMRPFVSGSAGAVMVSLTAVVGGGGASLGKGAMRDTAPGAAGFLNANNSAGDAEESGRERTARAGKNGRRGGTAGDSDDAADFGAHWQPPRYDAWAPAPVYGPPLPPERINAQIQAHRLLQDMAAGRLSVMMDERDGEQLRCLERDGVYAWPAPPPGVVTRSPRQRDVLEGTSENAVADDALLLSGGGGAKQQIALTSRAEKQSDGLLASRGVMPRRSPTINPADDPDFDPCVLPPSPGLLRLLTTLTAHSTPARPLRVMSLLRPPYRYGGFVHVGPANPHSLGLAVDIAAYGGHEVRQSEPEQCVAATLALLRALPPGRYRLGLPKAPESGWPMPPALASLLRRSEIAPAVTAPAAPISPAETLPSKNVSSDSSAKASSYASAQTSRLSRFSLSDDAFKSLETSSESAEAAAGTSSATGSAIAALYGLHSSSAKPAWPFFPPPYTELIEDTKNEDGAALPTGGETPGAAGQGDGAGARGGSSSKTALKTVVRFQNESYAPESGIADSRLRRALQSARQRGVEIIALFPDGADHIHIDARQNP